MKKFHFLIIAFFAVPILFFTASKALAISWEHDLDAALHLAEGSGKPVMADFYTDWCGWCKKLDSDTYSDGNVDSLSQNFICVKINADSSRETAAKYNVRGYPTILFLNSKGSVIKSVVGYRPPSDFAKLMQEALDSAGQPSGRENPAETKGTAPEEKPAVRPAQKPAEKFDIEELKRNALKKMERMKNHDLQLDGILFNPNPPRAIINNKIVKKGDVINDATVTSIESDKVELSLPNGEKITLKID